MKKTIITVGIFMMTLLSITSLFAQTKPFMSFELKTIRTKHKDATGQMTDWDKDQKVKNTTLILNIKSESGANEVKIINTKTSTVDNIISFDGSDKGVEGNNQYIIVKGGKDITDKTCSVKIIRPDEDGGIAHARWIKIQIIHDDDIAEYDAKNIN